MAELAARIEALLLSRQGWVSGDEIAAAFGIDKRDLRANGNQRGICKAFAISSSRGFKHLRWATQEEVFQAYGQRRKHGIGELIDARAMLRAWRLFAQPVPEPRAVLPRVTGEGQGLLF